MTVGGEAADLLKNITVTDVNFDIAWEALAKRYGNQRMIVHAHLCTLLSLSPMQGESSNELKRLLNGTQSAVRALQALGRPVSHWDDWLIHITTQKLDSVTRKDWEASISASNDLPKFSCLEDFLLNRVRALEFIAPTKSKKVFESATTRKNIHISRKIASNFKSTSCPSCSGKHLLLFCPQFRQKSAKERERFVTKEQLCYNCLRSTHTADSCPSVNRCTICKQLHHTMLHETASSKQNGPPVESTSSVNAHLANRDTNRPVLLATAWVNVRNRDGSDIRLRALLDQGSEASFISESAVQLLKLHRRRLTLKVTGIGATHTITTRGCTQLHLASCLLNQFIINVQAFILETLTNILPSVTTSLRTWPTVFQLQLADPTFYRAAPIDLILGADIYAHLLLDGVLKCNSESLVAQNTHLGWVISGSLRPLGHLSMEQIQGSSTNTNSLIVQYADQAQLNFQLQKFWEVEEVPIISALTEDKEECEAHFLKSYSRDDSGRFTVSLPRKMDPDKSLVLGHSRSLAIQRFLQTEKTLQRNPELNHLYKEFMNCYLTLGHMSDISSHNNLASNLSEICYLPHHGVLKSSGSLKKIRVVFNASQKTSSGLSLNDTLHSGPKLQQDLLSVIMRWRTHLVAFIADIEKMYRQIWVHPADRDLQRIVWRGEKEGKIKDYQLNTVTYGTTCAPYLAIKTLQTLATLEHDRFPEGSRALTQDCYVDDILSGADDVEAAKQLKLQVIELLRSGGFILKKWSTNCTELLSDIPIQDQETSLKCSLDSDNIIKTLGILWFSDTDEFGFHINLGKPPTSVTKRSILSDISKFFDPMGWLSPTIITAKIMFQKLWLLRVDWDDLLPEDITYEWLTFREELSQLHTIRIPRWINTSPLQLICELHGFSDASENAYSAVVYLRVTLLDNTIHTNILISKTKVAPLKVLSIPRLELCGALLLAKLLKAVKTIMGYEKLTTFAWTDSTTVLAWLKATPRRWKPFIAQIQEQLPDAYWRYVPTDSNPADIASRGIRPSEMLAAETWWKGPAWLPQHSSRWPVQTASQGAVGHIEERQMIQANVVAADSVWDVLLCKYSSLKKLLRVTVYCLRFIYHKRKQSESTQEEFFADEMRDALKFWIAFVQRAEFSTEIRALSGGKQLCSRSSIIRLTPHLDKFGILRVGGRLQHANCEFEAKHPAILPKKSALTTLLIDDAHRETLHGGIQLTLSHLRTKFWILGGRDRVRQHIYNCISCFRHSKVQQQQLMADLPSYRVKPARAFLHSGIDYAGPVTIKSLKGRGGKVLKGYIAVFICLCTKAVHLELVSDLTAEAFIAAFRRFTARRGKCMDLYSDHGTTFTGANTELRQLLKQAHKSYDLPKLLDSDGLRWHFIPPASPHFGGIWEAAVKSVKHHLKRVIGQTILTFEELTTLLSQIEACLNSRPITPLSSDPNDMNALTPGHFLVGSALLSIPEPNLLDIRENQLSRWQLLQRLYQHFWNRWSDDYLNQLQQRNKWTKPTQSLKVDDMVLIKDDRLPPSRWLLGRVITTHPGLDGLVRVASIRTQTGILQRPIVKLILLPFSDNKKLDTNSNP